MASIGFTARRGGRPHLFRRTRPRWRRVLDVAGMVVGATVLSTVGYLAVSYAFRDRPGPRSVNSALQQYRRNTATTTALAGGASTTSSPALPATRPAAGVYQLAGQGSEHISFPPNA